MQSSVVSEAYIYVAIWNLHMRRYLKHNAVFPAVSCSLRDELQTCGTDKTVIRNDTILVTKVNALDT